MGARRRPCRARGALRSNDRRRRQRWVLWSAFPRRVPVEVFGIPVPFLFAEPNAAIARRVEGPHKLLSYLLLIVIVVHVAAALRHHFVKRNDILRRMLAG